LVTLNLDLGKLSGEIRAAKPDYFLNVPALLERMRKAVDEQIWKTGGIILSIYSRAKAAWTRKQEGKKQAMDGFWLGLANGLVFPAIRKKMIGPKLRGLISGSAPLNIETQHYFSMLGIPVLQVYGLTETTGICTMDDPRRVVPGRVGPAIDGLEMKLGGNDEILVRGTNVFTGYWNRPEETAKVLRDGWFHTGDQGEIDAAGNWRIAGRIKNLIILGSGHNIAPEPIEEKVLPLPRPVRNRWFLWGTAADIFRPSSPAQLHASKRRPRWMRQIHRFLITNRSALFIYKRNRSLLIMVC
jgi:long-chain acyl-CoA synthetase